MSSNEISREDLQDILEEILNLSRPKEISPEEMSNKIMLLQYALSVNHCQSNLKLWATLHMMLGDSLYQNPEGNLDDNIEKAIGHYNQALDIYTRKDFPLDWAMAHNNLAIAYSDRILGDKAENIETAIEHYNQALDVYTHKNFPLDWAMTQNNLANAYSERILGDRAKNFEKALEHYNLALEFRTRENFPEDWAGTQNNIAAAYYDRILGDRAENIEKAIEHYNQALEVYTRKDFSVGWARIQNSLATAYMSRIMGDRAENIERAIKHCIQSFEVFTRKDFPVDLAKTQHTLGIAYSDRIFGDRAENVEKAIEYTSQALEVYSRKGLPKDWGAQAQNNLATAYMSRLLGDRAENIERANEYLNLSLEVRTREDFPVDWAQSHHNLGLTYNYRLLGDRSENIEKAIEHYNQALEVYNRNDFPIHWAGVQNNLSIAYLERILGDRAENFEKVIEHYNQALEIFTRKDFPIDWARTQNNLAAAYMIRILGNRAENIEKAISHCHSALEIYKAESMPHDFRNTYSLLGDLYLDISQWKHALDSYSNAIVAGDILYRSGLSPQSKTVEIGVNASVYRKAAFAACQLGLITEALLALEGGKTRLLNESLRLKMKQPVNVPDEEWIKYELAAEKYRNATKPCDHKKDYLEKEKEARKALEELDGSLEALQIYNPNFLKKLEISDILSILDSETALLIFCITDKGSIGFLICGANDIKSVNISNFKAEDLNSLLFKSDEQGCIMGSWVDDYLGYHNASEANRYDAFKTWQTTLNDVLSNVGCSLLFPLLDGIPYHIKKLILLPAGGLFLLPLHAVPLSDGELLCQRYCISYAPSISLLKEMKNKVETVEGEGIYEVINPEEDHSLVFSECEGKAISKFFHSPLINVGETGTVSTVINNVPGKAYLHFSCHGSYNWNDPLQSGLRFVEGLTLSLSDLQSDIVDMSSARLVTLSACETGITDIIKSSAEEYVGLPAGFMLAGVPCVVSSLWSVPEISTALLMKRLYSNHIIKKMDVPLALQDAQLWVRNISSVQVLEFIEKCYNLDKWEGKSKEKIERYMELYRKMVKEFPDEKPFQHPYYWAAFTVYGA